MHLNRETVYKQSIQAFDSTITKYGDDPNHWPLSVRLTVARLIEILERHQKPKTVRPNSDGRLSVFLSCSRSYKVEGESNLFEVARELIETNCGVRVVIGNDEPKGEWLEETVRLQIENCHAFVAVLTKDELSGQVLEDSETRFMPSPWIIFELGIAFALQKPFTIVKSEEISQNFHGRILSAKDFINSTNFDFEYHDKLVEATRRAIGQYGRSITKKIGLQRGTS